MRELKFRVWLPEHDTFIFPQFIYPHICDFIRGNDNYVIGQLVPYFKYEKGLKFDACFVYSNFDKNQMGEVNDYIDDIEHVIQQYTGLKDKNRKDIYEGDIVKSVDGVSKLDVEYAEYAHGEVKWLREGFEVCQARIGATKLSVFSKCDCCTADLEIIGNIYETPELLTQ